MIGRLFFLGGIRRGLEMCDMWYFVLNSSPRPQVVFHLKSDAWSH